MCWDSSHSMTWGRSSRSQRSRTACAIMFRLSEAVNSMGSVSDQSGDVGPEGLQALNAAQGR